MKSKSKKQRMPKKLKGPSKSYLIIQITGVTFVLVIISMVGVLTFNVINNPKVLGANTKATLFADQGSDTQEDSNLSEEQQPPPPTGTDHPANLPPQGHFEVQEENNINENKGAVHISAHRKDTNAIHSHGDRFDKLNKELKNKDIKVSSTSGDGFSIDAGRIRAKTHFPLSVDPTTHTLTVTTPAGTKEVTILPDQAVHNLLQHQILSTINQSSGSGTTDNTISLTQVNNQPVFSIPGQSDKKFLGLFPVSFNKTVFVSAQTGQVIQTKENFLNKFLETFSF